MTIAQRIGFIAGLVGFALTLVLPAPAGMPPQAWIVAGLVVWMAAWWINYLFQQVHYCMGKGCNLMHWRCLSHWPLVRMA